MNSNPRARRGPKRPNPLDDFRRRINNLQGSHQHPRNGKVARLPEPTRTLINQWLDDGHTYRAILERLRLLQPPLRYPISEMNLSNWFTGGYKDWAGRRLLKQVTQQGATPSSAPVSRDALALALACQQLH